MNLCVIPARGGSKRIPKKNILSFCGKPIIEWSISAALTSGCFDRVFVSTDDLEIAETALACGADVPFMRPNSLADDYTDTASVVRHAIDWQNSMSPEASYVCCLYATAPFVTATDIRAGYEILLGRGVSYVLSVTSYVYPIQRAIKILENGGVEMFQPVHFSSRSQDLEPAWHDAGQFYWGKASAWLSKTPVFGKGSLAYILPRYQVQDIDTLDDWRRAELLFRAGRGI